MFFLNNKIRQVVLAILAMLSAVICWFILITTCFIKLPVSVPTEFGYRPKPLTNVVWNKEGRGYTHYNSDGFIGDLRKENSRSIRILILGDSFMEAWQVPQEDSFASKLSYMLNNNQKIKYSVFNAGASGLEMAHYIAYGQRYLDFFNPDLVLIQVSSDDFYEDAIKNEKNVHIDFLETGNPYIIENQSNAQIFKRFQVIRNFISNDKFYNELESMFWSFKLVTAERREKIFHGGLKEMFLSYQNMFGNKKLAAKNNENTEIIIKEKQNSFNILATWEITEIKKTYGITPVVFMYIPEIQYINNDAIRSEVDTARSSFIKKICNNIGVGFIDLYEPFRNQYRSAATPVQGFANSDPFTGHLNEVGHSIMAEIIKEYIERTSPL